MTLSLTPTVFKIKIHCYNHMGIDFANTVAQIVDAAHKYDIVEICTMTEPFDIREIEWHGTRFLDILKSICEKNNWPLSKFHIISWNPIQPDSTWPSLTRQWYAQPFTYSYRKKVVLNKDIQSHFGIFINNSSWPRLWLSAYLYSYYKSKTNQTFVRTRANPGHMACLDVDALLFNFAGSNMFDRVGLERIAEFVDQLPITSSTIDLTDNTDMHFDTSFSYNDVLSPVADDLMNRYQHIFCDVVCETMFTGETFSLTEKIARCFLTKTPFLVVGCKGYLELLKVLGFKTFENYWSEAYDYNEGAFRCVEIAKVIDKISEKTVPELQELYKSIIPLLNHNKKRYIELCKDPSLNQQVLELIQTRSPN